MSSIFSDPPFRRGTTLCAGDLKDTGTGVDLPGSELVGQIKAFQDVNPSTGERYSNRLVYCQAVRYKGATVSDASSVAGTLYTVDVTLENGKPFATITSKTDWSGTPAVDLEKEIGVLDEYLTGSLTQNDVVWLVVKGPTQIRQTAAAVTPGKQVAPSGTAGQIAHGTTAAIGMAIGAAATAATANLTPRVNLYSDHV